MFYTKKSLALIGAWKADPSLARTDCPDSVVSGLDSQSTLGDCARTKQDSTNKLISYVCNLFTVKTDYICQKIKEGTYFYDMLIFW